VADPVRTRIAAKVKAALDRELGTLPDIALRSDTPVRTVITVKSPAGNRLFTVQLITHRPNP
jgi:hypothetical protein